MSASLEAGPAITRFDFVRGSDRGSHLTLYPHCLVHRSDQHVETVPMGGITAVRVGFERDARRVAWGIGLLVIALVVYAISGPLGALAADGAAQMTGAGPNGVARALYALFGILGAIASVLPFLALACAIAGVAFGALGWTGRTELVLDLGGSKRRYAIRGRSSALLEFSEALCERLTSGER